MTDSIADYGEYLRVFFPFMQDQLASAVSSGGRFAYYTSADVASQILDKQEFWLRNATVMNDFSEIEHGFQCLNAAYTGEAGARLKGFLNGLYPGLITDIEATINQWLPIIRTDTYLACLSEHPPEEDKTGRLSMWRAYGGASGVALVLNGGVMFRPSDALGAYSYPVHYSDPTAFVGALGRVIDSLEVNQDYLRSMGKDRVKEAMFAVFRYVMLCTKHPGFREEREWRVVASPLMAKPDRMKHEIETVRGVPQMVVKLPLEDSPADNLMGISIPDLLDRVIIGPCQFPLVIARAFHELLVRRGVSRPESRIIISDIPLRNV